MHLSQAGYRVCAWIQEEAARYKYPRVVDFLEYVKYRWMVTFRKLDDPKVLHPLPLFRYSGSLF